MKDVPELLPGQCPICGALGSLTSFANETFSVGSTVVVVDGLNGVRCGACGDVLFDDESARRYAAAGDELVLRSRGDA